MADMVYMDVPEVQKIAKSFTEASEVLQKVASVMDAVADVLRMTAFIGLVGGAVLAQWIDQIQPVVQRLATFCEEISGDIDIAVQNFINGDTEGAGRFG